jgi:hypothetical protein
MNSTRFNIVFFAALSLGSCSRGATPSATTDAISVGGTVISLPAPDGFFRYDGKSAKVDTFEQQFVSATNRLLATFGSEETLGGVLKDQVPQSERHFAAESERSLETRDITASLFAQLKPSLRRTVSSPLDEKYRSVIEEMESNASSSAGASIRLGEIISLGVFDDTSDSLCFSAFTKAEADTTSQSYVSIIACCAIRVKNRVFYLYANAPYRDKSDIEWARRSAQRWRDAVLKANSR